MVEKTNEATGNGMKFYFLALFISTPILGMAQIIDEYPELIPFFASEEFQTSSSGCEIVLYEGLDEGIANLRMEFTREGMRSQLRISSSVIDKKLFSAEEIKFIICHELGHKNDKDMLKRLFLSEAGVLASRIAVLSTLAYSYIRKKWSSAFIAGLTFPAIFFAGSFFKAKVSRSCESFADEYAVKLTKKKEAALSALKKRRLFIPEKQYAYSFFNDINDLFEEHPTIEARCTHINEMTI